MLKVLGEGYKISFLHGPPKFNGVRSTPLVGQYSDVLLQEVRDLFIKNALERVPDCVAHTGFYSTYFLVPKKTGDGK